MLDGQAPFQVLTLGNIRMDTKESERVAVLRLRNDLPSFEHPFVRPVLASYPVFARQYRNLALHVSLNIGHDR